MNETLIIEENERLKARVADLEARITALRSAAVQRKYVRLEREREIRGAIKRVIEELDAMIPGRGNGRPVPGEEKPGTAECGLIR